MKYESTILKRLIDTHGVVGNPRYISEIIKEFIVRGKERFPELFTYQADWLAHIDEFGLNPTYTVSYTGQSIYAPNTLERPVKSAILTGQTLVNTFQFKDKNDFISSGSLIIEDNVLAFNVNGDYQNFWLKNNGLIKPNTTYLFHIEVVENTTTYRDGLAVSSTAIALTSTLSGNGQDSCFDNGLVVTIDELSKNRKVIKTFKSKSELSGNESLLTRAYINPNLLSGTLKFRMMIIEYQEGMESWDIPYFEGMQSVKMPVLTTTGKNLIGYKKFQTRMNATITDLQENSITFDTKDVWAGLVQDVTLIPNTQYTLSCITSTNIIKPYIRHVLVGGGFSGAEGGRNTFSFTTNETGKISISFENGDMENPNKTGLTVSNIQLEKGSTATSYEPYKTNILTVNEEVELRGIGEVQDTLDCLTGEVITKTNVFNDWDNANIVKASNYGTVSRYDLRINVKPRGNIISNLFNKGTISTSNLECINTHNSANLIQTQVLTSKLSEDTVSGFKEWAKNNNYTLIYELETESVKTVDLTIKDHNGQSVDHLKSFNGGTHVYTSSIDGSLVPSVDISVDTDLEETLKMCSLDGNTM